MCEFGLFGDKVRTLFMDLLFPYRNHAHMVPSSLFTPHLTSQSSPFRLYSIQKAKEKKTNLSTDELTVDPATKNQLADKVSKWRLLVQYSGVIETGPVLSLLHLIRVYN